MMPSFFETAFATAPNIVYSSQSPIDENAPLSRRVHHFVTTNGKFWLGLGITIGAASLACSYFFTPFSALGLIPSVISVFIGIRKLNAATDPTSPLIPNPHLPSYTMAQYIQELQQRFAFMPQLYAHHQPSFYSQQIQNVLNLPEAKEKFNSIFRLLAGFPSLRGLLFENANVNAVLINDIIAHYTQASNVDRFFLVDALFGFTRTSLNNATPETQLKVLHILERFIPSLSRDLGTPSIRRLRDILIEPETTQKLATLLRLSSYFPMIRDILIAQASFNENDQVMVNRILREYDNAALKDKKAFEEAIQLVLIYACYELSEERADTLATTIQSLSSNNIINFLLSVF